MRHWLAGVLARERPALFRDLPESRASGPAAGICLRQRVIHAYLRRSFCCLSP